MGRKELLPDEVTMVTHALRVAIRSYQLLLSMGAVDHNTSFTIRELQSLLRSLETKP